MIATPLPGEPTLVDDRASRILDAAVRLLSKFDIVETVRTGKVVMARGLADT